jgi:hypothetical protein
MTTPLWIGACATALGVTIATFAAWLAARQLRRERAGRQVTARVVDVVLRRSVGKGKTSTYHYPVFEFVADDGKSFRRQSAFGDGKPTYKMGDEVAIWYDPADPQRADIRGEGRMFFAALALMGLLFAAGGVVVLVISRFG